VLPRGKGREVAVAFQKSSEGEKGEVPGQDAIGQTVDDVLVRAQVVLVLVVVSLVPLVTTTAGATAGGARLTWALQQAVLEVIEGAHTRGVLGVETAEEGVERVIAHQGHPGVETGDPTLGHGQTGAEHGDGVASGSSPGVRVERSQERASIVEIGLFHLAPDVKMTMVGAQTATAAGLAAHETNILLVWEGLW
jgi:hypothetical protein